MDKSTKLPSAPGLSLRVATTNIEIILQKTSSLVAQIATGAKQKGLESNPSLSIINSHEVSAAAGKEKLVYGADEFPEENV